jgi:hypothetical protein
MKVSIFKHLVVGLAIVAVFGVVVMLLWNALVPDIFGLAAIGFWQALGLLALARLLFGGIGWKMAGAGMCRHRNPIHEKWMKMTPEERKEFINKRHKFFHKHSLDKHAFWSERGFDFDTNDESKKGDE